MRLFFTFAEKVEGLPNWKPFHIRRLAAKSDMEDIQWNGGQVRSWPTWMRMILRGIMSRPLRIEYPDAWYHVMNRGRRGEDIFSDEQDYVMFTELRKETSEMWDIRIVEFCLIPNQSQRAKSGLDHVTGDFHPISSRPCRAYTRRSSRRQKAARLSLGLGRTIVRN